MVDTACVYGRNNVDLPLVIRPVPHEKRRRIQA